MWPILRLYWVHFTGGKSWCKTWFSFIKRAENNTSSAFSHRVIKLSKSFPKNPHLLSLLRRLWHRSLLFYPDIQTTLERHTAVWISRLISWRSKVLGHSVREPWECAVHNLSESIWQSHRWCEDWRIGYLWWLLQNFRGGLSGEAESRGWNGEFIQLHPGPMNDELNRFSGIEPEVIELSPLWHMSHLKVNGVGIRGGHNHISIICILVETVLRENRMQIGCV